jgi:uncharacterized protein (DUF433 family)
MMSTSEMSLLTYDGITIERGGGVPVFEGTGIPVATVICELGNGRAIGDLVAEYPDLTHERVLAGLRFAARAVNALE